MHAGGASNFHVPLISSVRNLTNDLSPCHALVTKSINGTVKFPHAFSDGTAVPACFLALALQAALSIDVSCALNQQKLVYICVVSTKIFI